ncbi:MAG: DUF2145 domain-containing protein [Proteobacteria bacterium]|nr:DUF2145 domain-containing protein [Pseudomonadota bacterium]
MPRLSSLLASVCLLLGLASHHAPATAGRSCEAKALTAQDFGLGMQLAQRTAQALDGSGAQVVLLARAGQDLQKYGLHYSHLGVAYKDDSGAWRVVHKLNQCGTARASIYRQGLGEFFLDDMWRYEAAYAVPAPEVQARLLDLLKGPRAQLLRLNQPAYSVVSYAWGQKYQQSNQWVIETLAMAMEPSGASERARAQAWLQFKGYEPSTIRLGPLTRLGGRITAANVAFDDHPNEKRFSDRIETVTVDSVFVWLTRSGMAAKPVALQL